MKSITVALNIKDRVVNKTGDPEVDKLLPTVFVKQSAELEIRGVDISIANGIRRLLLCGTDALGLAVVNFNTDDRFIIVDEVMRRVSLIPISQESKIDTKYKLSVKNTSNDVMPVFAKSLEGKTKTFEPLIEICDLQSGKFLELEVIVRMYKNCAQASLAQRVVCLPLDQTPIDLTTGKGVPSSIANPYAHMIKFDTNGNVSIPKLLKAVCTEFIFIMNSARNGVKQKAEDGATDYIIYGGDETVAMAILKSYTNTQKTLIRHDTKHIGNSTTENRYVGITIYSQNADELLKNAIEDVVEKIGVIEKKL